MIDVFSVFALAFFALGVSLILIFTFVRRVAEGPIDDAIMDVAGIKLVGYEALIGTVIAVALVASVTVHSNIREEVREAQTIEAMLRWHPAFKLGSETIPWSAEAVAGALTDVALQAANPELVEMISEAGQNLSNRHCSTVSSLASSWVLTFVVVGILMILILLHAILMSWRLTGVRILMPVLIFSLLACFLAVAFDFYKYVRAETASAACQPMMSAP